jgi:uncharacterized protein with LGFP repeats
MRRFFGKLANVIRQTNKPGPAQGGRRRTSLQVEALETRQLLSISPVTAVIAAPLNVPPLTPIQFKYQSLGGSSGFLGKAVTGELPTPFGGGKYEKFQHGNIYWSASTGAHDLYGPILNEYLLTASEHDAHGNSAQKDLGLPTTDVEGLQSIPGAEAVEFQGGIIYWSAQTGAHTMYGGIWTEYQATFSEFDANGYVSTQLGLPTSDEINVPGVAGGRMNTFAGDNAIYWSQATGAHVVYGAIAAKYNSLGGPAAFGLPTSDEVKVQSLPGVFVTNCKTNYAIYWSAATGAHAVWGAIEAEYLTTAGETDYYGRNVRVLLGAPTSDVIPVVGLHGTVANEVTFQGGNIYNSSVGGAHVVYGGILAKYLSLGGPSSFLGLPMSDELGLAAQGSFAAERISYFEHGWISWNPERGAYVV